MNRLARGLHYAMWMQDKMLQQEELSDEYGSLIKLFCTEDEIIEYLRSMLQTLSKHWGNIDNWRMDKFLQVCFFKSIFSNWVFSWFVVFSVLISFICVTKNGTRNWLKMRWFLCNKQWLLLKMAVFVNHSNFILRTSIWRNWIMLAICRKISLWNFCSLTLDWWKSQMLRE